MKEKITYSDKLAFQIEASRNLVFEDSSNFNYQKFIQMLELAGFNLRTKSPIIEHLVHKEHKDRTVEYAVTWYTATHHRLKIVLDNYSSEKDIRDSMIYKHFMGHTSKYGSRKIKIRNDKHKNIILGRSGRGIGFPDIKNPYCLKLDLDNHNYLRHDPLYNDCVYDALDDRNEREEYLEKLISDLISDLGVAPIYIARSLSGGYHVYFRISDRIFSRHEYILYFCKKYGYDKNDIEISSTGKSMRIPGHWTYTAGIWDEEFDCFIPDDSRTNFIDCFIDNFDNPLYISDCRNYQAWFSGFSSPEEEYAFHKEVEDTIREENEREYLSSFDTNGDYIIEENIPEIENENKPKRIWDTRKVNVFRSRKTSDSIKDIETIVQSCKFGKGTRNYNIYKIGCFTAHTDYETFKETVLKAHDGTSRDFKSLTDIDVDNMLKTVWNNVQVRKLIPEVTRPIDGKLISNAHYVSNSMKIQLEKPDFTSHWLGVCDLNSKYKFVNDNHHRYISLIFVEMLGYMYHQQMNKRQLRNGFEDRTDLCAGYIFPEPWCKAVQEHYKISFSVYRAMLKILKWLNENIATWNIKETYDGKDYQFFGIAYCRQYAPIVYGYSKQSYVFSLMSGVVNRIKSLYSSDKTLPDIGCSTYMMCNSSAKGPWIIESNGIRIPCPPG